ncbi:MAG TPA: hypothetical protein VGJ16_01160, partial [Pirellulales bacterium]
MADTALKSASRAASVLAGAAGPAAGGAKNAISWRPACEVQLKQFACESPASDLGFSWVAAL